MIEGAKQEQERFAWLTLPGKREVGTPRVGRAQQLTVLGRDGRHLLKVVFFNVNLGKQFFFAGCEKDGKQDKDKPNLMQQPVKWDFFRSGNAPVSDLGSGISMLLENPDTTLARAAITGGIGTVQLYLRWHLYL